MFLDTDPCGSFCIPLNACLQGCSANLYMLLPFNYCYEKKICLLNQKQLLYYYYY